MTKMTGVMFDGFELDNYDYKVDEAVITKSKLSLAWKEEDVQFHLLASSKDGGHTYAGTYGCPVLNSQWKMELTRYTAVTGSVLLVGHWWQEDNGNESYCLFQLAAQHK